jgi:hypothetical protein
MAPRKWRRQRSHGNRASSRRRSRRRPAASGSPSYIASEKVLQEEIYQALRASRTLSRQAPDLARLLSARHDVTKGAPGAAAAAESRVHDDLARTIAARLTPSLWRVIGNYRIRRKHVRVPEGAGARAEMQRADSIMRGTLKLLKLVRPTDAVVQRAIRKGLLSGRTPGQEILSLRGLPLGTLGDLARSAAGETEYDALWQIESTARRRGEPNMVLLDLWNKAVAWFLAANRQARGRRGRPGDKLRARLAEVLAIQLVGAGVEPHAGTTTAYGRVLQVIQRAAGCETHEVMRDTRRALRQDSVKYAVASLNARTPRGPRT